jgi:thiol-disulfide isomerase/thioredoxin
MTDFWDLVNIEEFWEKRDYFDAERWDVAFYCKDCEKIVQTQREWEKKYIFSCVECSWKNIAIWTQAGLKENYFRKSF